MKYQFFDGLDADGVNSTLDEYEPTPWTVKAIGHNADGYWILLETVFNPNE